MAKSRNAGCAAYMSPERIEPSDPTRPDYDIRADNWSLGITLVSLTNHPCLLGWPIVNLSISLQ